MTRRLVHVIPDVYARKALGQQTAHPRYTPAQFGAFLGTLCLAEAQQPRGYFASEKVLAALLEADGSGADYAAEVPWLVEQGDLIAQPDGSLYVEGWKELQEGDWPASERLRRYRCRRDREAPIDIDPADDPAVVYMGYIGSFPRGRAIEWIDDLIRQFGAPGVCSALHEAAASGTENLLGRASDALRVKERLARRREQREEEERVAERRRSGANVPLLMAQHNSGQHPDRVRHCPYCERAA